MEELMLKIDNVSKMYKLGLIGGTTLRDELQRRAAKRRGKEDPTRIIGARSYEDGETFLALDGVSFEVKKGERVGIIGHNGAGKSTLLKLISRVTAPTSGKIGLNGRVASMLEVGTGFHGELTGRENIYMNGAILGMTKKEIDSKIEDIIEFSEVRQFIDTPVKRYSSGMYVKLAFSVAAHLDSEIMIMDEVLAVGDMAFQKKCLEKMSDVSKTEGRTILYVSHNMNTIRQLCDRVIVLDHGHVVFDGDVEEGIDTYVSTNRSRLSAHIDCRQFIRHSCDLGKKAYITDVDFLDENAPSFSDAKTIRVKISWKGIEPLEQVKLGFSLKGPDRGNIGFGYTETSFNSLVGDNVGFFTFDLSNLSPGLYLVFLNMFVCGKIGDLHSIDQSDKIAIEIVDNGNRPIIWQKQYWGNLIVNPIIVGEIKNE